MDRKRKTLLPKDFSVGNSLREWSQCKFGVSHLPDAFLPAFKRHFLDLNVQAGRNGKKLSWATALQRWVREASPAGGMYRPREWEERLRQAAAMDAEHEKRAAGQVFGDTQPWKEVPKRLSPDEIQRRRLQAGAWRQILT